MLFRSLLPLLAALLFLLPGAPARAQLKWDHPIQRFQRVPQDKEIYAHYSFHNAGSAPVTIKALQSSCGCTTAHLDKKNYAPGETGEVVLHFTFGDRKGSYRKTVTVTTDDKSAEPVVLNLLIYIHDPVAIAPALVFWKVGEPAAAKSVQFTVDPSQPVHIKSVTSSNPRVSAKFDATKPGEVYAIAITPADTAQKESAEINVLTDFPADAPCAYTIHARIK
jgi:hypothetical protein